MKRPLFTVDSASVYWQLGRQGEGVFSEMISLVPSGKLVVPSITGLSKDDDTVNTTAKGRDSTATAKNSNPTQKTGAITVREKPLNLVMAWFFRLGVTSTKSR